MKHFEAFIVLYAVVLVWITFFRCLDGKRSSKNFLVGALKALVYGVYLYFIGWLFSWALDYPVWIGFPLTFALMLAVIHPLMGVIKRLEAMDAEPRC